MKLSLIIPVLCLFILSYGAVQAMPSLSGPGGLITIPSAYVKTGGVVAPSAAISDNPQTITSLNYAFGSSMELGLQQTEHNGTGTNIKYQLAPDKGGAEGPPATAIGFLDQRMEHTKSFYGVMSKNLQAQDTVPFILHLGVISEGSFAGHIRPIAGFETLLSSQMRLVGEYNGSKRDFNGGVIYNFTQAMGSFIYMMDVEGSGLNADMVSGFTFNLAF